MRHIQVLAMATIALLSANATALAQSQILSNPGTSTTPGVTQPSSPTPTNNQVNFQNIQNLNVGQQQPTNNNPLPSLQFSSINVASPVVYPSRFGTSNVLTTVSPQQTIAQPLPSVTTSSTSSTTSISPPLSTFTFTPSQQFQPIYTPTPFAPPSQRPFVAK